MARNVDGTYTLDIYEALQMFLFDVYIYASADERDDRRTWKKCVSIEGVITTKMPTKVTLRRETNLAFTRSIAYSFN